VSKSKSELSSIAIIEHVKAAGIVGAGGAGFPTHVKLDASVDTVIANGAECEPMLHVDQHVMAQYPREVVAGLRLAMTAAGADRGIIALKREYGSAVEALSAAIAGEPDMELFLMDSFYPAGDEFILVYDALGRLVPEGGLPLEVGVVVQNVGTLQQIARAAQGQAVTHRYVTVAGEVNRPCTLRAPVGASLRQVIDWAGGPARTSSSDAWCDLAVIVGGPMMGALADDLSTPVTKTTSGVLVLPRDNVVARYKERPVDRWVVRGSATCDQCRDCTTLCPRYLLGHDFRPHEIMRVISYGLADHPEFVTAAVMCCECRLCEAYACPLELSPMAFYATIKKELQAAGWRNVVHRRTDFDPHPYRDYRRVPMRRLYARLDLTRYQGAPNPLDERLLQPDRVTIPLKQHIGAPAAPTVRKGDRVTVGDLIGTIPDGKLGAAVHASIAGVVAGIEDGCVIIQADLSGVSSHNGRE
jgi:Na+-translocating ferredoxin:NAD+ oxidoreductase RnfC subunit